MAAKSDISFFQGEDVKIRVTMVPAVNITGWTIKFSLKNKHSDPTSLLTKTTSSGITIVDSVNGIFEITLSSADTLSLTADKMYVFDVVRTNVDNKTVLIQGTLNLQDTSSL